MKEKFRKEYLEGFKVKSKSGLNNKNECSCKYVGCIASEIQWRNDKVDQR